MSEVVHITENANQPEARVSALSLSELGILIGNSLPTADPLAVGALWNDGGILKVSPTPIAVSDFQNGVYSINGVSKTFDDLWSSGSAHLVANVGFEISGDWPGGSGSASGSATASAELTAVADPQLGFTAVIDVAPASSGDGDYFFHFGMADLGHEHIYFYDDRCELRTDNVIDQSYTGLALNVPHRIAATFSPTAVAFAMDGLPPKACGVSSVYASLHTLFLYESVVNSSGQPGGASMICERIRFHRPQSGPRLQALSAASGL